MIKEFIGPTLLSTIQDIIAEFVKEKICEFKDKKVWDNFQTDLNDWIGKFEKETDGTIITKDEFFSYLKNYKVIDIIFSYVFSPENIKKKLKDFVNDLIIDFIEIKNVSLMPEDKSVIKTFFSQLIKKCEDFNNEKLEPSDRALLYNTVQQILKSENNLENKMDQSVDKICKEINKNGEDNINFSIVKIHYPTIFNYINRNIILSENYSEIRFDYLLSNKSTTLLKAIQENNLVILLGDAGSGKSYQLQKLAHDLAESKNNLYPALIRLYNYVNKDIEDIIPNEYKGILKHSDKTLTFILDGYDEIQEKDTNDFIRKLNDFIKNYPNVKFIISSRTNFFKITKLKDFKYFYIAPLSSDDILNYIKSKIYDTDNFNNEVYNNDLQELLNIPFYLHAIISLYLENKTLPKRTELMNRLIEQSFKFDSEHYNTTKDIADEKINLFKLLEIIGFSLNCLVKNYLTEEEYQNLLEKQQRNLLKYSGIWKKNCDNNWQFLHNNFGEYLTAKLISNKSLEEIISIITYNDKKSIKPSWLNTLSFITSLYKSDDLKDWISKNSPELLIKFEKDRFSNEERLEIFKIVFKTYSEKATWVDYNVMKDLVVFGESRNTLLFLLDQIKAPQNIQSLKNALDIMYLFNKTFNQGEKIVEILSTYIFDDDIDEYVINRAILVLENLKLQAKKLTDKLVEKFKNNDKSYIRYGMYVYLHTSEFLDENIDFFINGLKYHFENINNEDSRIGNEFFELLKGIDKVSTIEAFEKVVDYVISYNSSNYIYSEELSKTILKLAEKLYIKSKTIIFNKVYSLLLSTYKNRGEIKEHFVNFFENTNTQEKVLEKLAKDNNFKYKFYIHDFYYDGCYKKIISMYQKEEISNETALSFIYSMNQNTKEFDELAALIKQKTGEVIEKRENIDCNKLRIEGTQKFFNALFDKAEFQKLIDEIIKISSNDKLTMEDAIQDKHKFYNTHKDLELTVWSVYHWFGNKNMLLSTFSKEVDWEHFSFYQIYERLQIKNNEINISSEQKQYIYDYLYAKITKIKFSKAIVFKGDKSYNFSPYVSMLLFFMTYFNFESDESVLLNMLIYPFETNIEKQSYFDYIEQRVNLGKMKERVIENIKNNKLMGTVMKEHIKFCIKHSIYDVDVEDTIIKVCVNHERDEFLKRVAIDYLIMLLSDDIMDKSDFYQNVVAKLDEKSLFYVAEKLYKENDKDLIKNLEEKADSVENKDTLMAYLIKMNSDIGIKYYIELLKSTNKTPTNFSRGEEMTKAIGMINDLNKLSYIIELIDIRFTDGFKDCDFQSLYSSLSDCLYLLGIQNNESYNKVNEELKKILDKTDNNSKSKNEIHKIAFINIVLDRIKENYLTTNEGILSISDVKKLLANVR